MKLVKSDLILEEFSIINSNYSFIEPEQDSVNTKEVMKEYNIDIDFIVRDIKNENNLFIIFTKVEINNNDNKKPGYSLFAEGVSIFSFNKNSKLTDREKSEFLWSSGVSISINNLRNYLSSITSYCPLGKYTLPSVDLTSLLNTKKEMLNEPKKKDKK
jgi:preprotein translocase subunit SecB